MFIAYEINLMVRQRQWYGPTSMVRSNANGTFQRQGSRKRINDSRCIP